MLLLKGKDDAQPFVAADGPPAFCRGKVYRGPPQNNTLGVMTKERKVNTRLIGLLLIALLAACAKPETDREKAIQQYEFKLAENDTVLYRFNLVTGSAEAQLIAKNATAQIFKPASAGGTKRFEFKLSEGDTVLYRFDRISGSAEAQLITKDVTMQIYKPAESKTK